MHAGEFQRRAKMAGGRRRLGERPVNLATADGYGRYVTAR